VIRFVLASESPARLATLRGAGVEPEVIPSGVDEDDVRAESPAALVQALARLKACAVADGIDGPALVLGCDSLLELDGVAYGKPGSTAAAADRWRTMRGRTGTLHTGHHLIDTGSGWSSSHSVPTTVRFADVTDDEIARYTATGEPSVVAGAFTIDGLGGWFVESIDGDHHNVVGVSLPTLRAMLRQLGHELEAIGYPTTTSLSGELAP
jgi:septum formation protein